jgi:hypothetical protein
MILHHAWPTLCHPCRGLRLANEMI